MALSQAYHHLLKRVPGVIAHLIRYREFSMSEEASGLVYVSDPSGWLTQWWDAKCRFGCEFLDKTISLDPEILKENLVTSLKRARTSLRCLFDFAVIYGYKALDQVDIPSLLLEYLIQDFLGVLIVNFKYHLLWLANRGRGAEAPPRKEEVRNLDGWLIDWKFRCWCLRRLKRESSFGETLLLGVKRGLPSMDERNVETEVNSLLTDLGTASPATPDFLLKQVSRTAREIFGIQTPKPSQRFQFSDRAGFEEEAGVAKGGIRGVVWRWALAKGLVTTEYVLVSMKWGPVCGLVSEYSFSDFDHYPRLWDGLYRLWIEDSRVTQKRPTKCRLAVIFEPLKVRPITAGESMRYALGKAFQFPLWSALQKFPCFSFTGAPAGAAVVSGQLNLPLGDASDPDYCRTSPFKDLLLVSADYKGATNYMHSDCTQAVLDAVYSSPDYRAIAEDLVGSHEIHHFNKGQKGVGRVLLRKVLQSSGQLMGSMISFPILCCVNVAVLRAAYERTLGRRLSLKRIPALINGDDLAARMTTETYDLWSSWIPHVGFFESPGKSYISRDWVQINSRTFDMEDLPIVGLTAVKSRGFVNMGVIEGFKKGIEPQHEPSMENVAVALGTIRKEFSDLHGKTRQRAEQLFRKRYLARCRKAYAQGLIPYIPSLDNPIELRGLGFGPNIRELEITRGWVDWKAYETACRWRYCKPCLTEYLSGELLPNELRWERRDVKDQPDSWDAFWARKDDERRRAYLD